MLALLLPLAAHAAVDSDLVKAGVAAYDELEYDKAIDLLHKALAESLTRDEKLVTYRTLAFSHVALGDEASARERFKALLRVDPTIKLDRTISPRVRKVFDEARAQMPPAELVVTPVPGKPVEHQKPVYKKAWFWATLGSIVVAGAVVGTAVGVTSSGPGPDTPASLTIQLH
jgi:tetratricopeptide (TPR) repeat protein